MGFWQIMQSHRGRKIHKYAHYAHVYERHMLAYANRPLLVVEIGCGLGGSLQMWKQYFGPLVKVVGLDIRKECREFEESQIFVRIGSQSDSTFLKSIIDEFGTPDIVIDDGSHMMKDIKASFDYLYPRISATGLYLVEDLHAAYWERYGGGLGVPESFVERSKGLIDELNADRTKGAVPLTDFWRSTLSIHFYPSVVVFEKGSYGRKSVDFYGAAEQEEEQAISEA